MLWLQWASVPPPSKRGGAVEAVAADTQGPLDRSAVMEVGLALFNAKPVSQAGKASWCMSPQEVGVVSRLARPAVAAVVTVGSSVEPLRSVSVPVALVVVAVAMPARARAERVALVEEPQAEPGASVPLLRRALDKAERKRQGAHAAERGPEGPTPRRALIFKAVRVAETILAAKSQAELRAEDWAHSVTGAVVRAAAVTTVGAEASRLRRVSPRAVVVDLPTHRETRRKPIREVAPPPVETGTPTTVRVSASVERAGAKPQAASVVTAESLLSIERASI